MTASSQCREKLGTLTKVCSHCPIECFSEQIIAKLKVLTASLQSAPSHGTLSLNSDGAFVYTPTADFYGVDTFVYIASDGLLMDVATVTITVEAVDTGFFIYLPFVAKP